MNTDWQELLNEEGANFADDIITDFGNPERERQATVSGTVITALSHLGVIKVTGTDAATFLQGQLTNDIKQLSEESFQYSGYCNPQGRLLAIFQIFQLNGDHYLLLPRSLVDETLERLKKYTLMSKVTLKDSSDEWAIMGLFGKQAEECLHAIINTDLPTTPYAAITWNDVKIIHTTGPGYRFMIFGQFSACKPLWTQLRGVAAAVGAYNWGWHDIQAGIPTVYPETSASFIPQMVNLDCFNGINFKKGCYTGQEVIARLHYRGKLKRRMYLAHIPDLANDQMPQPGDILYHDEADTEGKAIGQVVRCQPSPDGGYSILAVIVIELADKGLKNGQLHWQSATGPTLMGQPLPYQFINPDE